MGKKIVAVTFNSRAGYAGSSSSNKRYHYLTDLDVAVGDVCVVESPSGEAFVTVRALEPVGGIRHASKWIICKVDRSAYERRQELQEQIKDAEVLVQVELEKAEQAYVRQQLVLVYPQLARPIALLDGLKAQLAAIS